MRLERLDSTLVWCGVLAMVSALSWMLAAVILNPWFRFTRDALSALGSPGATDPWVYNLGLIFTSVLLFAFAASLVDLFNNRIEVVGASFLMVSAIFLALVGVYHGGTYPHDFVSLWFFVQADISVFTTGFGNLVENRQSGAMVLALGTLSTVLARLIPWQSSAEVEAFGTFAIAAFVLLETRHALKRLNSHNRVMKED